MYSFLQFQFTILFLLVLSNIVYAQPEEPVITNPIPPSPNASKLAQFDITPTNLYTGAHNLSVPLYTIQIDGESITILLRYHSGGIRANEEASWVGLGWALSTGGTLSRTVQGLDDFIQKPGITGYVYDDQEIPTEYINCSSGSGCDDPFFHYMNQGLKDTEPDIFNYNFMGSSGKFVLSKKYLSGSIEIIKLSVNADRVEYDEANDRFIITTPSGFKGLFSVKEYVTGISGSNGNDDWSACNTNLVPMADILSRGGRSATSWHLSKIISPKGKEVNYNYAIKANGYSDYTSITSGAFGEVESVTSDFVGISSGSYQSCSRTIYENVYLNSITSSDLELSIIFNKTSRVDMDYLNPSNSAYNSWRGSISGERGNTFNNSYRPQRLTSVRIYNTDTGLSNLDFTINLNQTYFNNAGSYDMKRLRLDGVTIEDQDYDFEYYDGLPNKSTKGVDYWGYYNGQDDNTVLRPVVLNFPVIHQYYSQAFTPQNYYYQTEDRKANFSYGKAGLLNKVTYPTGGSTEYEYESHKYKLTGEERAGDNIGGRIQYAANAEYLVSSTTFNFRGYSGDCNNRIDLFMAVSCKLSYLGDECTVESGDMNKNAVELIDPSGTVIHVLKFRELWANSTNKYTKEVFYHTNPVNINTLDPGVYTLNTYKVIGSNGITKYYGEANISFPGRGCLNIPDAEPAPVKYNQVAGGARVKTITNKDVNGRQLLKRSFQYARSDQGGNFSEGKLMNPLLLMQYASWGSGQFRWVFTSGSSLDGGNAASGSHIGYSFVREYYEGEVGDAGLKDYDYKNDPNIFSPWNPTGNFLAKVNKSYADYNGSIEGEHTYNNQNQAITSVNYEMDYSNPIQVNALKSRYFKQEEGAYRNVFPTFYRIFGYRDKLDKKIETQHFSGAASTERVRTETEYFYNSKMQPTRVLKKDDNGNVYLREDFKRPPDIASPSGIVNEMMSQNIISPVLEHQVRTNGAFTGATGYKYKEVDGHVVLDKAYVYNADNGGFVSTSNGFTFNGGYEEEVSYNQYDDQGNVLESVSRSGIVTTYIWGYNKKYPVAKIEGVTRTQVESVAGIGANYHSGNGALPESKRSSIMSSYPQAQIWTYTYSQSVGVLTAKDPNNITTKYEYDNQGRLTTVRDSDNNILKTIEYQY